MKVAATSKSQVLRAAAMRTSQPRCGDCHAAGAGEKELAKEKRFFYSRRMDRFPLLRICLSVVAGFWPAVAPGFASPESEGLARLGPDESAEVVFPSRGSAVVDFCPGGALRPIKGGGRPGSISLFSTPLFDAGVEVAGSHVALQLEIRRKAPLPALPKTLTKVLLARLDAGKRYQFVFTWDVAGNRFDVWLNGALQESVTEIRIPFWEDGMPELAGRWTAGAATGGARLYDRELTAPEIAELAHLLPPLAGEGRTLMEGPLDVKAGKSLFHADFSKPLDVVAEASLFDSDRRVREPDAEWVIEGEGRAFTEGGELVIETDRPTPPSRWEGGGAVWETPGHVVLWLNKRLPERILVEYDLTVEDPSRGLQILFFAARGPDGGSIFQPGLSMRGGRFDKYIRNPSEFLSYHVSLWAAPYGLPRRSSNLRKNGDFLLLAAGDDRIAPNGSGPHRIRVLHDGARIAAEVGGVRVIDFQEDPALSGPPLPGGYVGLRMMGDARRIRISNFSISEPAP